ncbi:hypothetical protein [Laceyella putida]|uniref:Uncharacterized protein n=1 Tax=Laceyella putida TaxID=110101 RepID=A0ABW2RMC3_9BACL
MSTKKKKKKKSLRKKTNTKKAPTVSPEVKPDLTPVAPHFPQLPSANIAKILSGFMTFRSTVKDLSQSIQRVENMMDNAYQMFEIATKVMSNMNQQGGFPSLPGGNRPPSTLDEDIPVIKMPFDDEPTPGPFPGQMPSFNFGNIFSLLQSPLFQRLISGFFRSSRPAAASYKKREG